MMSENTYIKLISTINNINNLIKIYYLELDNLDKLSKSCYLSFKTTIETRKNKSAATTSPRRSAKVPTEKSFSI